MLIKKYYSNYTGEQIDEAVNAIINNQIKLEDLSPELVQVIQKWIQEGMQSAQELEFKNHFEFPNSGEAGKIYIAIDEQISYYWRDDHYEVIKGPIPEIDIITCGGATDGGIKN